MGHSAAPLWRWAGLRVQGAAFELHPEKHWDTCAFINAIHASSHVLQVALPLVQGIAKIRHALRGTNMPPQIQGKLLANWNTSSGFLEGADCAYRALLLGALWRPGGEELPDYLDKSLGPKVKQWLESARKSGALWPTEEDEVKQWVESACKSDVPGPAEGDEAARGQRRRCTAAPPAVAAARVVASAVRFEGLHGPPSLEHVRDASVLRSLRRDGKRLAAFRHDASSGSLLRLDLAAVVEAERVTGGNVAASNLRLRRADRLKLECSFNLREGIASPFRIVSIEELLTEERPGGFRDAPEE